jgi:hypothetical protein
MPEVPFDRDEVVAALARTPQRLREQLDEFGIGDWDVPPATGEWSAADVLEHILAAEAVIAPRVFSLLVRPGLRLSAFDERRWGEVIRRARQTVPDQVDLFRARRMQLVGVLRSLQPDEWLITGEHEERGTITIEQCVTSFLQHEIGHVDQIVTALEAARQRREARA